MADEWNADTARKSLLDHELPPPGFTFAGASSSDRLRYGFPAEPDRQAQPHLWAKWERNLDRPWRRVLPEYELQPARPLPSPLPQGGLSTLADYGAMFFSDCLAGGTGFEVNLSGAGPVNMVAGGTTFSTALEVSATVLECYYGTKQP